MGGVLQVMLMLALSVELIVGFLGNTFMALVACMDWRKSRKISPVDRILLALAVSRLAMLLSFLLSLLVYPALMATRKTLRAMSTTWTITNHFSIWLATILSIYYFLKIANFSNSIFLYLKWRVRKVVLGALLVSLALLLLNIVVLNAHDGVWTNEYLSNVSYSFSSSKSVQFPTLVFCIITVFTFVPFTVSLAVFLLLIFSLWKHHKKMWHHVPGSKDASTVAHVRALQTTVAFLLLYAIFFFSLLLQFWNSKFLQEDRIILPLEVIGTTFPSGHTVVLILATRRLREASLSMLRWLRGMDRGLEPSDS
ncbi:PREDICTED: taste receptor type 2 member 14-like [Dipodomys ordii]|uniref:Taste receptor type 2 n=1 Tax=Dipodomys ordii TaxID=10020 RepID=A0A1S3FVS0_DIPOR|nr:PREDICTED: taste receptor type 2 member 14-like [Dipodomys ordii]